MCSGSSKAASINATLCIISALRLLICSDNLPFKRLMEFLRAYLFFEFMISITASAWLKSILPFKNARFVNSPGSAGLAPDLSTASRTFFITKEPPWQLISMVSSFVYVLGAAITITRTSSTISLLKTIFP